MKRIVWVVFALAALGLYVHYFGEFSVSQTIALLILTLGVWGLFARRKHTEVASLEPFERPVPPNLSQKLSESGREGVSFEPFEMTVTPNLGFMLSELGLVKSPQEWCELLGERPPYRPWKPGHGSYFGVRCTVLSIDEVGDILVNWQGPNVYSRSISIEVDIPEISTGPVIALAPGFEGESKFPKELFGGSVYWFFRRGNSGYEIGIRVHDEWLKARRAASGVPLTVISEDRSEVIEFGMTRLIFAVLPYNVTHWYFAGLINASKAEIDNNNKAITQASWTKEAFGKDHIQYKNSACTVWTNSLMPEIRLQ